MENTMNFVLQPPSLRHLALVKIGVQILWNQCDIVTKISQLASSNQQRKCSFSAALTIYPPTSVVITDDNKNQVWKKWTEIEIKAKEKMSTLPLPESCKKTLISFIKPLGLEIMDWSTRHYSLFLKDIKLIQQLVWTMFGTIDYKKTAELVVKNEGLAIERRYILACVNCLENDIRELFQRIPEDQKQEFINKVKSLERRRDTDWMVYWTCVIGQEIHQLDGFIRTTGYSLHQYMFRCAIFNKNLIASEYFLEKLNREERDEVITECALLVASTFKWTPSYKLLYLWSRLNEEQQGQLFGNKFHAVLQCLLRWPMQPLFMEAAERGWRNLDARHYKDVLVFMYDYIRHGYEDYDYFQLFREFWQLCPLDCKKNFISDGIILDLPYSTNEKWMEAIADDARHVELLARNGYKGEMIEILMDEKLLSDETLTECQTQLELDCAKVGEMEKKRMESKYHSRLVQGLLDKRKERRRMLTENKCVPAKEMYKSIDRK